MQRSFEEGTHLVCTFEREDASRANHGHDYYGRLVAVCSSSRLLRRSILCERRDLHCDHGVNRNRSNAA
eukprot:4115898-Pleurochrysis_carterae.AAC.1